MFKALGIHSYSIHPSSIHASILNKTASSDQSGPRVHSKVLQLIQKTEEEGTLPNSFTKPALHPDTNKARYGNHKKIKSQYSK